MPTFAGVAVMSGVLVALAVPIGHASAQQAAAAPCSGTFCDVYYGYFGNKPAAAEPARPAAPEGTPLVVPSLGRLFSSGSSEASPTPSASTAAPRASSSLVQVDGGGLLGPGGALSGRSAPDQRCTGTLCDAYYGVVGGPPAEPPPTQPVTAQATPQADAAAPDEPKTARRKHGVYAAERQEKPRCAAAGGDPWQCYR